MEKLLTKIASSQGLEGQWASEDGEAYAVGATIQALKVFKLYDKLPDIPHESLIFF